MKCRRLVLGTVQVGLDYGVANRRGRVPLDEARAILRLARENGMDCLDTAAAYGESEDTLGLLGVEQWKVITKLRGLPEVTDVAAWVREEVYESLRRLRLKSVYAVLVHRVDQLLGSNGDLIFSTLKTMQEEGTIGHVGISIYGPEDLDSLMPKFRFEIVQTPFNLLDRRIASSGWLDRCSERGILVHGRSTFLQGALVMPPAERAMRFPHWRNLWDRYEHWLAESGHDPVKACLGFALSEKRLDGVVVGVDAFSQFAELIQAVKTLVGNEYPDFSTTDIDLINPVRWKNV
jgi:aryl-alcohol dehydrogenase-like predicted oxidoreductase